MINSFVDLAGRNPQAELQQNITAILRSNSGVAKTIAGILGMKIVSFGPLDMNLVISHTLTVQHGLGYTPVFLVYYYNSALNQYIPLPMIDFGSGSTSLQSRLPATVVSAWVDQQNLYINWAGSAGSTTQQLYYFICKAQVGS